MTTLSRISGLVRDVCIANIFGAGTGSDAFFVAFKIPNYLRRLFAEGGFSQAFVPVLSEYKSKRDVAEVRDLLDYTSGKLSLVLFYITVIGVMAAPVIIMIFAAGFAGNENKFDLSVYMLRITFPYILFISLTAFAGGILNVYGRFAVPALTPVLLNISLISCHMAGTSDGTTFTATGMGCTLVLPALAQLLFQIPFLLGIQHCRDLD